MANAPRFAAVIVAAGSGDRFGAAASPKQYLDLGGIPLYLRSVRTFARVADVSEIVIVVRTGDEVKIREQIKSIADTVMPSIIAGGESRQESAYRGVISLKDHPPDFVLVHDAARALVTPMIIKDVVAATLEFGCAIAAIPVVDTLKVETAGKSERTISRDKLWRAQTPQAAPYFILVSAYEEAFKRGYVGTDESELLERIGYSSRLVRGSEENFKITFPEDFERALALIPRV